jgi:hypothetical protein
MSDTDSFDPVLVLSRLLRRHAAAINAPHACVLLINPYVNSLTIEYGVGVMEPYVGRIIQADDGVAGYVLSTKKAQFINDYLHWQKQYQRLIPETRERFQAVAGTPVYRNGNVWAILSFIWEEEAPLDAPLMQRVLEEISTNASALINHLESVVLPPDLPLISTGNLPAAAQ